MTQLVDRLPAALGAPICVSMHFPAYGISMLPKILTRADEIKAVHPQQHNPLRPGCIYIAPPDYHCWCGKGSLS
jgi:two-component system chemotaxis response regulator CheB